MTPSVNSQLVITGVGRTVSNSWLWRPHASTSHDWGQYFVLLPIL